MLELQKYLATHSFEQLELDLGIKAKRHQDFSNLVLFKYSQVDSPKLHPIVKESRGIILDEANNWQVVSYPFSRFFNAGESGADSLDLTTIQCLEKLDGSLLVLYFYAGEWQVATSGTPDASGQVGFFELTFKELFWKTWQELNYSLPHDPTCCYMFELCTKYNKVVIQYPEPRIVLLGVRDLATLQELKPQPIANWQGWECVKHYSFTSTQKMINLAKTLPAYESEGFVLVDKDFKRLKIKSPAYIAASRLSEGINLANSAERLLELIQLGEGDEFLVYHKQWSELLLELKAKYEALIHEAEQTYGKYSHIIDQKEFALKVKALPYAGILFMFRKGQLHSIAYGFKNTMARKLLPMMGY